MVAASAAAPSHRKQAFGDYLELKGFGGLLRRAAKAASFDLIAGSTPGMEHLLVLGKIKELDRERAADLIIVDAPPAGHAAPFLRSASALQAAAASGPVRDQADEVSALLADHHRCQCLLVTLPEETPVNEVIELAARPGGRPRPGARPAGGERLLARAAGLVDDGRRGREEAEGEPADPRPGRRSTTSSASAECGSTASTSSSPASTPACRCRASISPGCPSPRLFPAHLDVLAEALAAEPIEPERARRR